MLFKKEIIFISTSVKLESRIPQAGCSGIWLLGEWKSGLRHIESMPTKWAKNFLSGIKSINPEGKETVPGVYLAKRT